ncbi:hypothetical protein K504DRAFT_371987 [Pleomassaria siparia CBS 279.74]|uniref:T6SS Phospholipase effector Tle1-like catalytic domain-containing protein n=1 Tax=Pleomassaria siparia CBS 279.74 TaxID=1314801 RepID=A0A6G1KI52_9PLEO|nr:hypothetical protein K504DRAFT_371987 [Pleomassaria siparia CBS 279.74]
MAHAAPLVPSRAPSRAASRATSRPPSHSRAPSRAPMGADRDRGPLIVELPPLTPRPPIYVDIPAEKGARARSQSRNRALVEAPGLSRGRGMFKRLIVACDGTWMNSDNGLISGKIAVPSNVTRLTRAIKPVSQDAIPQVVYYHFGIGTQGGVVDRLVSGTTGEGLGDAVREGYSFLANNYHPGDEIFLLGFSRGAFTARSIAGLVGQVGLLTKKGLPSLPEIFKDVQHRRDPRYVPKNPNVPFSNKPSADSPRYAEELERRGMTRLDIPIKAIGVWDTVGSLGTPRIGWLTKVGIQSTESKEMAFYDTKLGPNIENAFQALALDEKRGAFSPAVWEKPEGNRTTLRQVWFPGVHSNVGGGYDDQQLANITLAWMMSQLEGLLDLRDEYIFEQDDDNERYYRKEREGPRPWSFGEIYNSMSGLYSLGGGSNRTPGRYHEVSPDTCRPTSRPLRQTNEYIHPSVRTRIRLSGPGVSDKGVYECRSLTDAYRLVVDYSTSHSNPNTTPTTAKPEPDIYWKCKFKDTDAVKVLPEAPLWRLERELCRRDREMWDAVKRPPATGNSAARAAQKRRKNVRPLSADMTNGHNGHARANNNNNRRSFVEETTTPHAARRSTMVAEKSETRTMRNRSRARSAEFERESVVRENMPHRRQKDKAWWEGVAENMGIKEKDKDRYDDVVEFEREKVRDVEKVRSSGKSPRFADERGGGGGGRSPRRSSMRV